jgi:flagellum-specific peptidoglycan hydrolase FlgJ
LCQKRQALYIDALLHASYDLHSIKKRDTMEKTRFLKRLAQPSQQAAIKRELLATRLHADPQ